jgi:hypothetical protein
MDLFSRHKDYPKQHPTLDGYITLPTTFNSE